MKFGGLVVLGVSKSGLGVMVTTVAATSYKHPGAKAWSMNKILEESGRATWIPKAAIISLEKTGETGATLIGSQTVSVEFGDVTRTIKCWSDVYSVDVKNGSATQKISQILQETGSAEDKLCGW